ncbi:type III secretion system protein SctP [Paraburkholderia phenazinium]|uniref:Type III secretion control protein HpaP n=1 Tax=Paraburkholderia phenazinium TaxID=60549 RepID=A0A1G8B8B8_9BURK|nr:type III secretion system protein SctP [Paraburkholderia phenazinium]SDH29381.1 type III secretion control protein HpaP [Paraburkholderia phenazinium]
MTHIESRHLRIIPGQDDAYDDASAAPSPASGSRGRQFDYASLLGRRRVLHRLGGDANAHAQADGQSDGEDAPQDESGVQAPRPFAREPDPQVARPWDGAAAHTSTRSPGSAADEAADSPERQALRARVAGAAMPVVSAVYQQQQRCLHLLGSLAREIGTFCSERAIADAGNWEVQLPLDQKLLPQTTLYLSLSRFRLQLRFDAPDLAARQLLLDHSSLLERELDTMLRAWGEAREIELTVW